MIYLSDDILSNNKYWRYLRRFENNWQRLWSI